MMCGVEELSLGLACLCSFETILSRPLLNTRTIVSQFLYDGHGLNAGCTMKAKAQCSNLGVNPNSATCCAVASHLIYLCASIKGFMSDFDFWHLTGLFWEVFNWMKIFV